MISHSDLADEIEPGLNSDLQDEIGFLQDEIGILQDEIGMPHVSDIRDRL